MRRRTGSVKVGGMFTKRLILTAAAALVLAGGAADTALGSKLQRVEPNVLKLDGGLYDANLLTIDPEVGGFTIYSSSPLLMLGSSDVLCDQAGDYAAWCDDDLAHKVKVNGGQLKDLIQISAPQPGEFVPQFSVQSFDGSDTVIGGPNGDHIIDSGGADTIIANGGPDYIRSWSHDDTIYGGAGNDTIWGGEGADEIHGGPGADIIQGAEGDDLIYGDAPQASADDGHDDIEGNEGDDTIHGGSTSDYLVGGEDDDELYGGGGPDDLFGEFGNDLLVGGTGLDTFDASYGDDKIDAQDGVAELVKCGFGQDTSIVKDLSDTTQDCEHARVGSGGVLTP